MPRMKDLHPALKPYTHHGLRFDVREDLNEATTDCPFCGKEGKFHVGLDTGQWQCKLCMEGNQKGGGNALIFIRLLWEMSLRQTREDEYRAFATERSLLAWETPREWEFAKSVLTGEWIVPGRNAEGRINQLYRYMYEREAEKFILIPTPALDEKKEDQERHGLFGRQLYDQDKEDLYVCEGPWDGMILWEVLKRARKDRGTEKLLRTANPDLSLLSSSNVLATPGCNVFYEPWLCLCGRKRVFLCFDNDYPREHPKTKEWIEPAGHNGMKRLTQMLSRADVRPEAVFYLRWSDLPDEVVDVNTWTHAYNDSLPDGYDLRDWFGEEGFGPGERLKEFSRLFDECYLRPVPDEFVQGRASDAKVEGGVVVESLPCSSWEDLYLAWEKPFTMTPGHKRALAVMLACAASTEMIGECPLWALIMGPPSSGKTSMMAGLEVARRYVHPKSELRPLYSGFKNDKDGTEDFSLIAQLHLKTLTVKDADPLLKSPARALILAQLRDAYDGATRSHFNNGTSRSYENLRMTVLLCGTSSLLELDAAEFGARFLICKIMDGMNQEFERAVGMRAFLQECENTLHLSNGKPEANKGKDIGEAQRMTGGYLEYLRKNINDLRGKLVVPIKYAKVLCGFGEFVAVARARPSLKQSEVAEREFSARLVKQFTRLAICLAIVLGKEEVDDEVVDMVRTIAKDTAGTAKSRSLTLLRHLHESGEDGMRAVDLALMLSEDVKETLRTLTFLRRTEAAIVFTPEPYVVNKGKPVILEPRWRLTDRVLDLYDQVLGEEFALV